MIMSEEMKLEIIKAAARVNSADVIGEALGIDINDVKAVIAESTSEIEAEKAYRKGQI